MKRKQISSIVLLSLVMVFCHEALAQQTISPLSFVEYKGGGGSTSKNDNLSYNSLPGNAGAVTLRDEATDANTYGYGFGVSVNTKDHKDFCFSIYKLEETVLPYSTRTYDFEFTVATSCSSWRSLASLYEFATLDDARSTIVQTDLDNHPDKPTVPAKGKLVCSAWASNNGTWQKGTGNSRVTLDNSRGSTAATLIRYYLLAVTNDRYDKSGKFAWGGFKPTKTVSETVYQLHGTGTQKDPFLIGGADDLCKFRDMVNGGGGNLCARLTRDIDMTGVIWIPIGRYTSDNTCRTGFAGTFDGDGYVVRNLSGSSTNDHDMGLIGRAAPGCLIRNLLVENVDFTSLYCSGGAIGYAHSDVTVENVGVVGDIRLKYLKTGYEGLGGITGGCGTNCAATKCYTYYDKLNGRGSLHASRSYCGNDVRRMSARGELCYLLNGSSGIRPTWLQTIGADDYPVLRDANPVYLTGTVFHNGELQLKGSGTADDPFQILNDNDLKFFADLVSHGYATICGKLLTDIDYAAYTSVSGMIGTESCPYSGIFDGNGHSIKMNFAVKEDGAGLFRFTRDVTVGNLMLLGAVSGTGTVGGLIAHAEGKTDVTRVLNKVEIRSQVSGSGLLGGFVGSVADNGSLWMGDCGFVGGFAAAGSSGNGGMVGSVGKNVKVELKNCFFVPERVDIKVDGNSFTFVRWQEGNGATVSLADCFYTKVMGREQGVAVTDEQVRDGELCFLLNGQSNADATWLQTLGTDAYPTLWLASRVYRLGNGTYSNDQSPLPGSGTAVDPFLIGSPTDLETFRDFVNRSKSRACARLTADIDMMDRNWIPIGRYTEDGTCRFAYSGTIDGDGFVISNLSGRSTTDRYLGLVGLATEDCTVKNLILNNVKLEGLNCCAPFIGNCQGNAAPTIENCASIGILIFSADQSDGNSAGGIIGSGSLKKTRNCYSVYSRLSGTGNSNAVNCYYGSDVEKKAATGELCYLLNGGTGSNHLWLQSIGTDPYPVQRGSLKVDRKDGQYYNIDFSESDNTPYDKELSSNDMRVIHHGGNLYEFIMNLGTKDGQGEHPFPDMRLSYNEDGSWVDIAELKNINREKVAFDKDWSGDISYSKGQFINPHTFQTQTPVFWIMQGNKTSVKTTSLLWLAPEGTKPIRLFKTETMTMPVRQVTSLTQPTAAPTGANAVNVTEATMDLQSDTPGTTTAVITSPNQVYSLGLWDATDNRFISTQEIPEGAQNATVSMPQQDRIHDIVALMYARQVNMAGTASDTTYVTYGVPFKVRPIHSIRRTNASQTYNNTNNLRWAIAFPEDEDLMADDNFSLTRAYKSDLSDAVPIKSFGLRDYKEVTVENDSVMGWFSFSDTSKDALSTAERYDDTQSAFGQWNLTGEAKAILTAYKYPARYIYYNVERVTISTLWTDSANYKARWKVLLTNVLPKVDSVKVIKTPDWERTHKVRLRLVLRNPYPEDLVGENDRMSVMEERKRQGFNSRMFAWDEKARIIIRRFSKEDEHYNGVDEVAETIIVEGGDVKSDPLTGNWFVEVFDTQTAPDTHYYYQAVVDNSKSDYPICTNMTEPTVSSEADANACYTNTIGSISDFKASQGEFVGLVGLSWESDNTGTLSLTKQRYKLGYDPVNSVKADDQTSEDDKDDDATDDGGQQSVIRIDGHKATDSHSLAGQVDEYILTKTITRRGKVYADTVRTLGYSVYKAGRISGYVRMADGMAFPGKVEVRVRLTSPERLLLRNIYARDGETLVMPGYTFDTEDITVTAGDDGYYEVDSLCYYGSGVQYTVTASSGNASFYNTTGESGGIALTLEDANHEYTNVDFVCRDTQRISGRIVYAGSTVPVRDMEFYVNDRKLVDTEGKAIVTDAAGEFSFAVPKLEMSIQARKNGHVLSGEGYILGGANASERVFTPTQDYDVTMTDSTTIRLVGRVAGGDAEGGKPLGFGESRNILGDSITLVLQLEGDNTSFIHYNMDNPDEKSVSRTFTQDVYLQNGGVRHTGMTNATFESKRIVIKADNETGEFSLDLFPAKYKLSQFYANGYGTLYLSGEGIHIIDLTDSTTNNRYENGKMQTEYCASFNKTYHAPAQLTVRQTEGGSALDYYGVEKLMVSTVAGLQDMETAWRQNGKVRYVFGHPVFRGGDTYTFLAEAFEEYRYNNSATGSRVRVPVGGRRLTVTNGFDNSHPVVSGLLNASGKMEFSVTPANANFSAVGENALLTLGAAVDIEGYSYQAEPVRAFVTGDRDMGVDVQAAVECTPQILDYIRDPYGANSYAYREKGTQYNWTSHYENDYKEYFQFSPKVGVAFFTEVGLGVMTGNKTEFFIGSDLNWVTQHDITQEDGEYRLSLNDRISTSSDPRDVGAMADIYIGSVSTVDVRKTQSFNVLSDSTYQMLTEAVGSGAIKVIARGTNSHGNDEYLVVADGQYAAPGTERTFVYTQKYILGTLIPSLQRARDRLTLESQDSIDMYNARIMDWQDIIKENERIKVEAMSATKNVTKQSIAGASIDHQEQGSSYYRKVSLKGAKPFTWSVTGGAGHSPGNTGRNNGDGNNEEEQGGNDNDVDNQNDNAENASEGGGGDDSTKDRHRGGRKGSLISGYGVYLSVSLGGGKNASVTNKVRNFVTTIGGSGYHLTCTDNSYIDLDIVCMNDSSLGMVNGTFKKSIDGYEGGSEYHGNSYENGKYTSQKIDTLGCYAHNYVFIQRGGASRNPWTDADSTFFCLDASGNRQPLGERSLRIDNPKITVENPIVYNQPQDEPAVFTVHLTNDTEINDKSKYLTPTTLYLKVDDKSNPDGAKVTMDGQPLKSAHTFVINPGQSIVKTIEVARGGKPYDYDDIKLLFFDNLVTVADSAFISVHYVPNSSPVNLSMPADNWLMNTLSQVDRDGRYYIPVQIDGFSTTQYDNFDHIELQYKKQTESEDQWVNLCSYYADKSLYDKATGQKAMIEDPTKISNIKFYGEKDPVEVRYDLRAVAFCRLGNGYVTRMSKVVSGTKDTRSPEVFGKPKPTDGILGYDDVISLPFTENIAYNYLDKTANFSVQGCTNSSDADHSSYLYFLGSSEQKAVSHVKRFGTDHDFSVEMMVKAQCEGMTGKSAFISLVDDADLSVNNGVTWSFGYLPEEDRLYAAFGDDVVRSRKLGGLSMSISSAMTHVAMTYSAVDSLVRFFVGDTEVKGETALRGKSNVSGYIHLGTNYKGLMSDIALWGYRLSDYEVAEKYKRALSAGEKGLVGYWPTDETHGNIIFDKANGADIYLNDVVWQTPSGYSLRVENKPVELSQDARLLFSRNNDADYTLAFWFRADERTPDDAVLFSAGGDELSETGMGKMRIRFCGGELVLRSEGRTLSLGATKSSLAASVWHHVAVAVNHSFNTASVFLDGEMVGQTSADNVGGIASSAIAFGDADFVGNFDNITLWGMALPEEYIRSNHNIGLSGKEAELLVNLNFEQQLRNSQGTMYVAFSPYNNVIVPETGKIEGKVMVDDAAVTPDADIYAPIRDGVGLQNLPFSWSSTDNELQINILKSDAEVNNQQVNLVVRNVEDLNGNPMMNPQMWSVYVNRNVIEWDADHIDVDIIYGSDTTVTVGFMNKSGRNISYSIDSNTSWLTLSKTKGWLAPLSSDDLRISVDRNMAPGSYSTFIYITDEDGLVSKLNFNLVVDVTFPYDEFPLDSTYSETMNIIAAVKKKSSSGNWVIDMNPKDIVAAFVDNKCLSLTPVSVDAIRNTAYAFMTIAGNSNIQDRVIEFYLWNAADGQIYVLEPGTETLTESGTKWEPYYIRYCNRQVIGADRPVVLRTTKQKAQWINLAKGWNWVSFNVRVPASNRLNNIFSGISEFTTGDIIQQMGTNFASYQSDRTWDDGMADVTLTKNDVFQIYSHYGGLITVLGAEFETHERVAELVFRNGSSWASLPYLLDVSQPINSALSDFVPGGPKAPAGTVIKSHDQFAVATDDGQWLGSLKYLIPGEGYYVKRNGLTDTVSISFTNTFVGKTPERPTRSLLADATPEEYVSSMPIVADWMDGEYREGDLLLAIANGRVVGVAEKTDGRFFLTVNADEGTEIRFAKMRDGQVVAATRKGIRYTATGVLGTLQSPYLIDFSDTDANSVYDITGIKYGDIESINARRGVFIIDGRKVLRK
ncbi:MAG: hypothetical protein MJY59_01495 [Bacteroidaceae bacterium]|nr:hypothetical protein [Bacteroidaceae bacterium]